MALMDDPLAVYQQWRIQQDDWLRGERVREDLQRFVDEELSDLNISVKLVGSCLSRVGIRGCDVDVVVESDRMWSLQKLVSALRNSATFHVVTFVSGARVPIVILRHLPTSSEVDVSLNTSDTVVVGHLLCAMGSINPLLQPMIVYVKKWAKSHDLIDAKNNFFSGFVLSLMVIFHQQQRNHMPVISATSARVSEADIRRSAAGKKMNIELSSRRLREQLIDFFEFFADFNYRKVMNIRTGKCDTRPIGWSKYDVAIMHPILGNRFNSAAFIYGSQLYSAKRRFRQTAKELKNRS